MKREGDYFIMLGLMMRPKFPTIVRIKNETLNILTTFSWLQCMHRAPPPPPPPKKNNQQQQQQQKKTPQTDHKVATTATRGYTDKAFCPQFTVVSTVCNL